MHILTLVTGNKGKLAEWQRLFKLDGFELVAEDIDLDEIQSLDLSEIVADKARRAYQAVGKPIIVEDISAGLDELNGLPGPFIKFFEKRLGLDALYQLAGTEGKPVSITCGIAYFDGEQLITAEAEVHGRAVAERGDHGFGFDKCVVLDGQTKTYGELTPAEKDAISHRAKAIKLFCQKLSSKLLV